MQCKKHFNKEIVDKSLFVNMLSGNIGPALRVINPFLFLCSLLTANGTIFNLTWIEHSMPSWEGNLLTDEAIQSRRPHPCIDIMNILDLCMVSIPDAGRKYESES